MPTNKTTLKEHAANLQFALREVIAILDDDTYEVEYDPAITSIRVFVRDASDCFWTPVIKDCVAIAAKHQVSFFITINSAGNLEGRFH